MNKKELFFLMLAFIIAGCFYLTHITTTGLQFDEGIEYFYSKYMTALPVNLHESPSGNMYERIISTYQPPLYNIMMYCWLCLFDSEFFFRLAGVIVTFVGALGFYFTLKKITDFRWAALGMLMYLSAYSVMYYALECAEYNLQLCMECWMIFFFIRCIDVKEVSRKDIIGFYLFAVLSIYSQYGSAFLIISLFIVLFHNYIKYKSYNSLRWLIIIGILVVFIFIVPLWIFFVEPQMTHQESLTISHRPVYVKNIIYSLILSIYNSISWIYTYIYATHVSMGSVAVFAIGTSFIFFIIIAIFRTHQRIYTLLVSTLLLCFLLYFFASAHSFYAYNAFEGKVGCYNIIWGKRYVLFIAPIFILTMMTSINQIYKSFPSKSKTRKLILLSNIGVVLILYAWMWLYGVVSKGKEREAIYAWIEMNGYNKKTLIQPEVLPAFYFYYIHSPKYDNNSNNIIPLHGHHLTTTIGYQTQQIKESDILSHNDFYFIYNEIFHYTELYDFLEEQGYNTKTAFEAGTAKVVYLYRDDRK